MATRNSIMDILDCVAFVKTDRCVTSGSESKKKYKLERGISPSRQLFCSNSVFHTLREVDAELKVPI
jgi:hypothetical protein